MKTLPLFFLLLSTTLWACEQSEHRPARIVEVNPGDPTEKGRQAVITVTDSNWTKVVVRVATAERYSDSLETRLIGGLEARFLDRQGRINALLRADSATIDDNTGDMCAQGNVVIHSPRNRTLVTTSSICYEKEAGMLHSKGAVVVDDSLRRRHIEGTGFETDESLGVYTFYNVTGTAKSID